MARTPKTKLVFTPAAHPKGFKMKAKILAREEVLGRRKRVPISTTKIETKVSKVSKKATKAPVKKVHGNTGRKHSEATKLKMSLSQKKRWARVRRVLKKGKKK